MNAKSVNKNIFLKIINVYKRTQYQLLIQNQKPQILRHHQQVQQFHQQFNPQVSKMKQINSSHHKIICRKLPIKIMMDPNLFKNNTQLI